METARSTVLNDPVFSALRIRGGRGGLVVREGEEVEEGLCDVLFTAGGHDTLGTYSSNRVLHLLVRLVAPYSISQRNVNQEEEAEETTTTTATSPSLLTLFTP